jgi:hypothetical protein
MGVTASGQATRASAGANLKWSLIQKHAAQQRQQCQMGTLISKPPAGAPLAPGSHTAAGNGHQLRVTWPAHPSLDDRSSTAPAHQPSPHAPAAPIKAKNTAQYKQDRQTCELCTIRLNSRETSTMKRHTQCTLLQHTYSLVVGPASCQYIVSTYSFILSLGFVVICHLHCPATPAQHST